MRDHSIPFLVIPITNGKSMLIDVADAPLVLRWKWQARRNTGRGRCWYVWRTSKVGVETKSGATTIYLHRLLLDAPKGLQVDHINGNPLDNRRSNLRLCTTSQNHANMGRPQTKSERRFVGVRQNRQGRFEAYITFKTRWISVGTFTSEEDAARARDAKAVELFGDFARLNFPGHDATAA